MDNSIKQIVVYVNSTPHGEHTQNIVLYLGAGIPDPDWDCESDTDSDTAYTMVDIHVGLSSSLI
jgi:hypothetical protein